MKTNATIGLIGMFFLLAYAGNAQDLDANRIKILPTAEQGVIKLHYALEINEPVEVKFFTRQEVAAVDRIEAGPYHQGISKRYDVRRIDHSEYWIEVSSPRLAVTYHVVPTPDGNNFIPYLEKTTYNHVMVKANN